MFGISTLGWVHTLGSLPAIPAALYMLGRHGRIVPRSAAGKLYFVSMLVGAATVFLVAKQPASAVVGVVTLLFLLVGYGAGRIGSLGRATPYVETVCLSISIFLLMLPTVSEILRRVPDGHPMVTDLKSPLLLGAQGGLLVLLLAGVAAQVMALRKRARA
ncbi:hypothetical protein ACLB1G_23075 [Oxalobacteraceae bacterium A2-2]